VEGETMILRIVVGLVILFLLLGCVGINNDLNRVKSENKKLKALLKDTKYAELIKTVFEEK
jgi:hypothetical protein